ncbi:MAG: hypothetical protein D6704_03785 [Nitrospirae bacterium]|nr:MAG: hypothetical protein D6704_03785 [Nitrospirota bacterium]
MKTLVLQGDGFAGAPSPECGDKTPLQVAETPNLDFLAQHGEYGVLTFPNEGPALTGDTLHLALLGYEPKKYYTGPGPFVGLSLEVTLGPQDVAFVCSLVTLGSSSGRVETKKLSSQVILLDDTAGGIDTEEARDLIDAINEQLGSESIQFYAGNGHRHLMVWVGGKGRLTCCDPHIVVGQEVGPYLPKGDGAQVITELMEAARVVLRSHPINLEREEAGMKPANGIWLWGPGKAVALPKAMERYGVKGATLSWSDLHAGIGLSVGFDAISIPREQKSEEYPYAQVAQTAIELLGKYDMVYLHLQEQPDPREGYLKEKVRRLESFDRHLVGPLLTGLSKMEAVRWLVVCNPWGEPLSPSDHRPTPYVFYDRSTAHPAQPSARYTEVDALASPYGAKEALRLAERLRPNRKA